MDQRLLNIGKGCAAALMVVLATAGMGRAQSGAQPPDVPRGVNPFGQYPHAWRYYDYPSASVGAPLMNPPVFMTSINYPGVYGAFIYGPGGGYWPAPGPHQTEYQANYAPVLPSDNRAHLTVAVPATARLWFNNALTRQTGSMRRFTSPPLTPGEPYHYDITARWTNGLGKEMTVNKAVTVTAGQWTNVDLLATAPAAEMHNEPVLTRPAPTPREAEMRGRTLPPPEPRTSQPDVRNNPPPAPEQTPRRTTPQP